MSSEQPITVSMRQLKEGGKLTGKWRMVAEFHRLDAQGKRIQKTQHFPKARGAKATQREAEAERVRWESELNRGDVVQIDPSRLTVSDWAQVWLRDYLAGCSPNYRTNSASWVRTWIDGTFMGGVQLQKLGPDNVTAWLNIMRKQAKKPATISINHRRLMAVINSAVTAKKLARNPIERTSPKEERKLMGQTKDVWSIDNCQRFIGAADQLKKTMERAALWAIFTGMRASEILALKWEDINWAHAEVHITRNQWYEKGIGPYEGAPKTSHSQRNVGLHAGALAVLRAQQKAQLKERSAEGGKGYTDEGLVFCNPKGNRYTLGAMRQSFIRLTDRLGLPRCRFHALRHAYATIMLGLFKEHISIVSAALGHSNVVITTKTYSHLLDGQFASSNAMWGKFISMSEGDASAATG